MHQGRLSLQPRFRWQRAHNALRCLTAVEFAAARKTKKWEVVSNNLNDPRGLFTTGPAIASGERHRQASVDIAGTTS